MKTKFELSEKDYRYLFENASDAMWVHDMEGNVLDGNKAAEKLGGYTHGEFIGMNIMKFLVGEESLQVARQVRRKLLKGEDVEQPYEQQLRRKDGMIRTVRMATSPITIDGEVRGFQHVARDVTEEKNLQAMLSKITNGSPIPSFVIDRKHKITHWNTAIEALSGISSKEIIGTDGQWRPFYTEKRPTMADLVMDGASASEIKAFYRDKSRKSQLIDSAYEAADFFPALGESGKWLYFTASPIKNEGGEIIAAIETLQDITEERQLQKNMHFYIQQVTRAQEEERKRLARELHDDVAPSLLLINQRLDAIASDKRFRLSNLLKGKLEDLQNQVDEALGNLRRSAQDLRPRIIDDLGLVAALEWMAENLTKDYKINATVEVVGAERSLPQELQLLLFRIVQEAVSNIRKHAEASRAQITLEFGDNKVILMVKDNGKGFELPQRIGDLTSSGKLGLAGMRERAQLIRGNLKLQSEPGKGTTVTVEVPA